MYTKFRASYCCSIRANLMWEKLIVGLLVKKWDFIDKSGTIFCGHKTHRNITIVWLCFVALYCSRFSPIQKFIWTASWSNLSCNLICRTGEHIDDSVGSKLRGWFFYILKCHTTQVRILTRYIRDIRKYVRRCIKRDKSSVKRDSGTNTPKAVLSRLNRDGWHLYAVQRGSRRVGYQYGSIDFRIHTI